MAGTDGDPWRPSVSVVLTTRDRPRFLPLALAGYRQQTYANRELIVVDDGERSPAAEEAVAEAGGRLVRAAPGTPLGSKLNAGIAVAHGELIQKFDDDDWYGPAFLASMVETLAARWATVCRPTLVFLSPFLFFDLAAWRIHRSVRGHLPGATVLFPRDLWEEAPFRPLPGDEDVWFLLDHARLGATIAAADAIERYLAVRHAGVGGDRGHTWTHQGTGARLDDDVRRLGVYDRSPDDLLPDWAVAAYRAIRGDGCRVSGC